MLRGKEAPTDGSTEPSLPGNELSMVWTNNNSVNRVRILENTILGAVTTRPPSAARSSSTSSSLPGALPLSRSSKSSMGSEDEILHIQKSLVDSEDDILHSRISTPISTNGSHQSSKSRHQRARSAKLSLSGNNDEVFEGTNKYSTGHSMDSIHRQNKSSNKDSILLIHKQNDSFDKDSIDTCSSSASGFLSPQESRRIVKYRSVKNDYEKGIELFIHDIALAGEKDETSDVSGLTSDMSTASSTSRYDSNILRERASMTERLRRHQQKLRKFQHELDTSYLKPQRPPTDLMNNGSKEDRTRAMLDLWLSVDNAAPSSSTASSGSYGPIVSSDTTRSKSTGRAAAAADTSEPETSSSARYARAIIRE
jgi:hypothetical protein